MGLYHGIPRFISVWMAINQEKIPRQTADPDSTIMIQMLSCSSGHWQCRLRRIGAAIILCLCLLVLWFVLPCCVVVVVVVVVVRLINRDRMDILRRSRYRVLYHRKVMQPCGVILIRPSRNCCSFIRHSSGHLFALIAMYPKCRRGI